LADSVFWNAWRTRQHPYSALGEGDTVYLLRRGDRVLVAELKVVGKTRSPYGKTSEIPTLLDRLWGIDPETLWWPPSPPDEGFLFAFADHLVRPLDIAAPSAFERLDRLGRNGFIPWQRLRPSTRTALENRLPRPGGRIRAYAEPPDPDWDNDLADPGVRRRRAVPVPISRAVYLRDGRQCKNCGTTRGPFHLDHRIPYSKGGETTIENLQVLCMTCNLSKGARVVR
jgi:hypothetical protein